MSVAGASNRGPVGRVAPAREAPERPLAAPRQATRPQSSPAPDPRSLVALSQALNAFLGEVNGGTGQAGESAQYKQAAAAYGDFSSAEPTPAAGAAQGARTPGTPSEALETIRDDFDRLYHGLETAAAQLSDGAWSADTTRTALLRIKADTVQFAAKLLQMTDDIESLSANTAPKPAPVAAPAPVQRPAPSAAPSSTGSPPPKAEASAERPSFLSQLSARFHRHFDEL